jgi:heme exporter protein A
LTLLTLEGVTCVRGGRLLFEGLDLTLAPGEAALVTGPNGAGKSSLIRIAAGLLRPTAGRVDRGKAALADEHLGLDERSSLGEALALWTRLDGLPAASDRATIGLATMVIVQLAAVPVRILSAGQRKRATLARVVASAAPLWLLDEPLNGLDADGQRQLESVVAAHRAEGGAVLAASHQPLDLPGAKTVALG